MTEPVLGLAFLTRYAYLPQLHASNYCYYPCIWFEFPKLLVRTDRLIHSSHSL